MAWLPHPPPPFVDKTLVLVKGPHKKLSVSFKTKRPDNQKRMARIKRERRTRMVMEDVRMRTHVPRAQIPYHNSIAQRPTYTRKEVTLRRAGPRPGILDTFSVTRWRSLRIPAHGGRPPWRHLTPPPLSWSVALAHFHCFRRNGGVVRILYMLYLWELSFLMQHP